MTTRLTAQHTKEAAQGGTAGQIASLKDVLSSLPDNLVSETELEVSDENATPQQRLEVLEQQEGASAIRWT